MAGINTNVQAPAPAPGVIPPQPVTTQPGQQVIPFRAAAPKKTLILDSTSVTQTTATQQQGPTTIQGEGYIEEIAIRVSVVTASNSATVAFTGDGTRAALQSVIFTGPGGDIFNVDGPSLVFHNAYDGKQSINYDASTDVSIYQAKSGSNSDSVGGSFVQWYRVPMAIGYRNLVGLVGNQDRATRYRLRNDLNASSSVYSTAPTTLGTAVINRYYTQRAVPAAADNFGRAQQQIPDANGIVHYVMSEIAQNAPVGGSTVKHYFSGLGNTWRRLILVWKQNTSRSSAETTMNVNNAPAQLTFFIGDNALFSEDWALRRRIMFDRYGFDAPSGVLVYDFANDFSVHSGEELGDDFLNTQNVVNMSLQVVYPSGFGSTSNSLTIIKDSLYVPAGLDLSSVMF